MTNVPHPISLAPAIDVAPHSYVIQLHTMGCANCKTITRFSTLYLKTHLRSRQGHKYVTNLRPIRRPEDATHNVPIESILVPMVTLPFCHECFDTCDLSHLPSPPPPPKTVVNLTKVPDAEPEAKPEAKRQSSKTKPTIDDLLI